MFLLLLAIARMRPPLPEERGRRSERGVHDRVESKGDSSSHARHDKDDTSLPGDEKRSDINALRSMLERVLLASSYFYLTVDITGSLGEHCSFFLTS